MPVSITSKGTFDDTVVQGTFVDVVNALNVSAAAGKQFSLFTEVASGRNVALETRNITRIRDLEEGIDDYIGRN